MDSTDNTAARTGIADYSFIKSLGAGNYGVFYLARRPKRLPVNAELVAVKVLEGASNPDMFRRAVRELSAFAAVDSPYLVTLYDAGQEGDDFYYSMEYLANGSLADPPGAAGQRMILTAMAHAARAAHALHEAGIAHNDIKPGNVLLQDGGGKLSDLGLSRVLTPGQTISGLGSAASVEYIDPQLIRGGQPSRATDVFALGATLHKALTGEGLYGDLPTDNALIAMRRVMSKPAMLSEHLDPAARAVIASATSTDYANRPRTALALAELIEALPA